MTPFIPIFCCLWLWLTTPVMIDLEPATEIINSQVTESSVQPIETYYLSVLGEGRREVQINPPATKIVVTSQSGDTIIRCGDDQNTYVCSPGKRLKLEYELTAPITKFWGENLSQNQVRLQIEVYQTVPLESNE